MSWVMSDQFMLPMINLFCLVEPKWMHPRPIIAILELSVLIPRFIRAVAFNVLNNVLTFLFDCAQLWLTLFLFWLYCISASAMYLSLL